MRNNLNAEMQDGLLSRVMNDEPIFPLAARDPRAPALVREWATQRRADISMGKRPESDTAQVDAAFAIADDMDEWRTENEGKWRNGLFAGVDNRP